VVDDPLRAVVEEHSEDAGGADEVKVLAARPVLPVLLGPILRFWKYFTEKNN
jgi:hypothetical protein